MREIIRKNKSESGSKLTMVIKKGQLFIENELYKKKVTVPSVGQIVSLEQPDKLEKIKLIEGQRIANKGCRFVAMSQEVSSINDVRLGYIKAKRKHPQALHVVCSYFIPGVETYHLQCSEDDGDHGVGRALLRVMTENQLKH